MCEPSLARGRFASRPWDTTSNLTSDHHSHRFRDINIRYPWSSAAPSSVPCWEPLPGDSGDSARCQNAGSACSCDFPPLDFLFPKLYYIPPGTGRGDQIIFEERRFVNNTTGNSDHACCSLYRSKPSSLSCVSCGYVRRYHSVYVRPHFLQSVNFFFFKKKDRCSRYSILMHSFAY